ncbi:FliH/SctL family protein [Novipirellula caenicola]|uniref:Flagellar assembly protein FliH n=1 Tax=Novipirellula caenicola TaxID=1536901 RepID=A0ABP9W0S6_9BACT
MAIVLKSERPSDPTNAARSVTGLAGFNLDDLADAGRSRIDECRKQVAAMLEQAKKDAELIRKQAHEQGYQDGLAKAAIDSEKKIKSQAETLAADSLKIIHNAVEHLHRIHEDWMQQYADSLTSIAIAAAEKVIRRQLANDETILVRWAEEALRSTRSATRLILAVHPETLVNLGQVFDELLASPDLPEQTMVEPDETVARDAVIVRQPGGEIRAGLEEQLLRLQELLV